MLNSDSETLLCNIPMLNSDTKTLLRNNTPMLNSDTGTLLCNIPMLNSDTETLLCNIIPTHAKNILKREREREEENEKNSKQSTTKMKKYLKNQTQSTLLTNIEKCVSGVPHWEFSDCVHCAFGVRHQREEERR